jgi:hypothetical protein
VCDIGRGNRPSASEECPAPLRCACEALPQGCNAVEAADENLGNFSITWVQLMQCVLEWIIVVNPHMHKAQNAVLDMNTATLHGSNNLAGFRVTDCILTFSS